MGFFKREAKQPVAKAAIPIPAKPAYEIDPDKAVPELPDTPGPIEGQNPRAQQPGEDSYEQWDDSNDETYSDMPQQPPVVQRPQPVVDYPRSRPMQPLPQQSQNSIPLSEEEILTKMKEEISKREEAIRLRKEEEERKREEAEAQWNQQAQTPQLQKVTYLSEAEMLREINRKIDALVVWAVDVSKLLQVRK
jgi:hypothetical protein